MRFSSFSQYIFFLYEFVTYKCNEREKENISDILRTAQQQTWVICVI